MNFIESVRQAFDAIKSNKLRSILTMLGIVMGVFSIITIVAIGNAAKSYMNTEFEKLGANVMAIQTRPGQSIRRSDQLQSLDIDYLVRMVPEIKNISGYLQKSAQASVNGQLRQTSVIGITSQYKSFSPMEILYGRSITDMDVTLQSKCVIIDDLFAEKYFKGYDPIGEKINLRRSNGSSIQLMIVGVMRSMQNVFAGFLNIDELPTTMMVPLSTLQAFYSDYKLDSITISIEKGDSIEDAGRRVISTLERKHNNKGKYYAISTKDIQNTAISVMNIISAVLLAIAIITLFVGGIGIVNILLVSVTERIREIGIRKALGARNADIIVQFLTESMIMTSISGLIGILLGIGAGGIISHIINIPPVVNIPVIIMAFLGSIILGIVFGVYPAKRAANLDPIDSLRYE